MNDIFSNISSKFLYFPSEKKIFLQIFFDDNFKFSENNVIELSP